MSCIPENLSFHTAILAFCYLTFLAVSFSLFKKITCCWICTVYFPVLLARAPISTSVFHRQALLALYTPAGQIKVTVILHGVRAVNFEI